ncbi:MAG: bifunctional folylpolyglutamate synthase/dihydrofolate synthase [Clostridia bacterium]|nr:bifunctional folylpolyglutamate synthase/dihydrofolate synthase [Clostridia bacterium]
MTYDEALEYIHGISWTFCKPGLERISELCEKLGNPEKSLKFVHIAGTNGKGSTASMLASVLSCAGYRVGLYTSPYIYRFNERMRVAGEDIPDETLAEITEYVRPIADKMTDKPTEFELITAIAFEYFKRERCDVVVLEAGLGGRLDSTNIIDTPVLSIITGIALDHTALLGDTVEKIALEKAGIIKNGIPVLYGGEDKSAESVISSVARERGADFYTADYSRLCVSRCEMCGSTFSYKDRENLEIHLLGSYQPRNASVVADAVDILNSRGFDISEVALREGLSLARWRARFEVLSTEPTVIFDGAHNPQGIDAAVDSIKSYYKDKRVIIMSGVLRDKDYEYIASRLATVAERVFTITPDNPRALDAEEYAATLRRFGAHATPCASISEALSLGRTAAKDADTALCCLGSLYTYSDVVKNLK